jgi:hypothetical protein
MGLFGLFGSDPEVEQYERETREQGFWLVYIDSRGKYFKTQKIQPNCKFVCRTNYPEEYGL